MKHDEAIAEYVAVDPWHIPGKSDESNAILEGYHENLKAWSQEQPAFQRHGHGAVRVIRKASEDAAGFVEADYFDLVFIDADHTFEAARRDIQVWAASGAAQWRNFGRARLLLVPPRQLLWP